MGPGLTRILKTALPGILGRSSQRGLSTGSGPSWLQGLARKGGLVGVLAMVAGLGFAGYSHWTSKPTPTTPPPVVSKTAAVPASANPPAPTATRRAALEPGTRYVRRDNSVLREAAKTSAKTLAHKAKGAAVTVLSVSADGWAEVRDGTLHGFMRASVLGEPPLPAK